MGKLIASWSPIQGKSGVTTTTTVLATVAAINKPYASLLMNASNNPNFIDKLTSNTSTKNAVFGEGIEGLKRLISSNLITAESVPDYAENILSNKLDIILGSKLEEVQSMILLRNAINAYEYIWIDLYSSDNDFANLVLKEADHILIHLPQSLYEIENSLKYLEPYLQSKNASLIIGQYDQQANLSVKNIKRKLKLTIPIYQMSYSSTLKNALNDKNLIEYLLKVAKQDRYSEKNMFVKDANEIIDSLIAHLSNNREDW